MYKILSGRIVLEKPGFFLAFLLFPTKNQMEIIVNILSFLNKRMWFHKIKHFLTAIKPFFSIDSYWVDYFQKRPRQQEPYVPLTAHRLTVSIVTPSYNQGKFLERTIQSVLSQNYRYLEYIIQDGGSTDESPQIIDRFRSQLHHAAIAKDKGQANAINLGFRHSTGDIMAWLNSDDLLLSDAVNYIVDYFQQHPSVDVVYGMRLYLDEEDQEIGYRILPQYMPSALKFLDYIPQETLFWRRRIWKKVGGYINESFQFSLDWEFILRLQQAGAKIVRLPRFLGAFRFHTAQKTNQMRLIQREEDAKIHTIFHGYPLPLGEIDVALRTFKLRTIWTEIRYRMGLKLR